MRTTDSPKAEGNKQMQVERRASENIFSVTIYLLLYTVLAEGICKMYMNSSSL